MNLSLYVEKISGHMSQGWSPVLPSYSSKQQEHLCLELLGERRPKAPSHSDSPQVAQLLCNDCE